MPNCRGLGGVLTNQRFPLIKDSSIKGVCLLKYISSILIQLQPANCRGNYGELLTEIAHWRLLSSSKIGKNDDNIGFFDPFLFWIMSWPCHQGVVIVFVDKSLIIDVICLISSWM